MEFLRQKKMEAPKVLDSLHVLGECPVHILSEVLGQQQSLNAVSSQVAKELQSLQQKDGRDVVDCAGVVIVRQRESRFSHHEPTHRLDFLFETALLPVFPHLPGEGC